LDAARVALATGWAVHAHGTLASTNDEAARLRDLGAHPRTAVVAQTQTAGRGRNGRAFLSPPGGLYVSMLLAPCAEDLPAWLGAAVAVACAEAVEATAGVEARVKWPNDLWIAGRKAGGILLESTGADRPVVAGVGIDVRSVPSDLPPNVRAATTCLDAEAGRAVDLEVLLGHLLIATDRAVVALAEPASRAALAHAWRGRLALIGERITYVHAGRACRGRLSDVRLEEGLLVEDDADGLVVRPAAHVQDVRPE
jgi:BirA family biotin operon repressor/biotin-[acetyl-CoA-carboxylase] ligase